MNKIIDIKNYQPQKDDMFLFDTNIWMYLSANKQLLLSQ